MAKTKKTKTATKTETPKVEVEQPTKDPLVGAHHWLDYNPDTGVFTWKESRGPNKEGDTADGETIMVDGQSYKRWELAYLMTYGYIPTNGVDFIDDDENNVAIKNLVEQPFK